MQYVLVKKQTQNTRVGMSDSRASVYKEKGEDNPQNSASVVLDIHLL